MINIIINAVLVIIAIISSFKITHTITMSKLADFQAQLDKITAATTAVSTEIASMKATLANSGLTPDEQATLLGNLTAAAASLEAVVNPPTAAATEVEPTTTA
jgi:hypothetical protein